MVRGNVTSVCIKLECVLAGDTTAVESLSGDSWMGSLCSTFCLVLTGVPSGPGMLSPLMATESCSELMLPLPRLSPCSWSIATIGVLTGMPSGFGMPSPPWAAESCGELTLPLSPLSPCGWLVATGGF